METFTKRSIVLNCLVSLNRTMQYGNYFLPGFRQGLCLFKSYYVVWKLDPPDEEKKEGYSLNRTMQYGNRLSEKKNTRKK